MSNFFKDNDDLLFKFKNIDLEEVIEYKENHFKDKDKYPYAPKNLKDAMDSYYRILDVAGQISGGIIAPLAPDVDEEGAQLINGDVKYAKGTEISLDACKKAELMSLTVPREYGGLNCPTTIYNMVIEMVSRADASFMNIFGLSADIANTIFKFADDDIKKEYIPKLASGECTAAMILTEPDAGSDLQAVMLKAHKDKDGQWYLNGVKRFITNGNGDIALVLARSEEGTHDARGLSMFLYERDKHMKIRRIENKLGIHGSPTCELQFNNAPAKLIGARRMGLIKYVMSLMNEARIGVSAQALGIAEAAYREAKKYAEERIQFKQKIINFHPVSEMLLSMKMRIETARALLYETTKYVDLKESIEQYIKENPEKKIELNPKLKKYKNLAGVLTPLTKAYVTEIANKVTYDTIQVHGGTGYMKDFNAERHYRDARITNIYEGTTQLQIVAAIGGIMKGVLSESFDDFDNKFDFSNLGHFHKIVLDMKNIFENTVQFVKEKNDKELIAYHARRLVEMGTNVFIGYLMLRDGLKSERKKAMTKYFLEYALPEVKMKSEIINNDTEFFFENKDILINGKN